MGLGAGLTKYINKAGGGLPLRVMYEIMRPIFLQNRIYTNTNFVWLIMKIIMVFY